MVFTARKVVGGVMCKAHALSQGGHAVSMIFYDYEDKKRHQHMALSDGNQAPSQAEKTLQRLLQMVDYCEEVTCRRAFICSYFDCAAVAPHCSPNAAMCDRCRAAPAALQDVTLEAQGVLQFLRAARAARPRGKAPPVTLHSVKEALLGSHAQRMAPWQELPGFGALRTWTEPEVLRLLRRLVVRSVLAEEVTTPVAASANVTVAYLIEGKYGEALQLGQLRIPLYRPMAAPASVSNSSFASAAATPRRTKKRKLVASPKPSQDRRNRNRRVSQTQIRALQSRQSGLGPGSSGQAIAMGQMAQQQALHGGSVQHQPLHQGGQASMQQTQQFQPQANNGFVQQPHMRATQQFPQQSNSAFMQQPHMQPTQQFPQQSSNGFVQQQTQQHAGVQPPLQQAQQFQLQTNNGFVQQPHIQSAQQFPLQGNHGFVQSQAQQGGMQPILQHAQHFQQHTSNGFVQQPTQQFAQQGHTGLVQRQAQPAGVQRPLQQAQQFQPQTNNGFVQQPHMQPAQHVSLQGNHGFVKSQTQQGGMQPPLQQAQQFQERASNGFVQQPTQQFAQQGHTGLVQPQAQPAGVQPQLQQAQQFQRPTHPQSVLPG
ncbi:unnamed protein product [Durusdinium trenchii]|uniref:Uncharacterized protein n=1 Tax=Durusdinium trenchii TaxID=1381693 RepID=A0ABP0J119_9DINO